MLGIPAEDLPKEQLPVQLRFQLDVVRRIGCQFFYGFMGLPVQHMVADKTHGVHKGPDILCLPDMLGCIS